MVREILAYICFAGAAVSFVAMFPRRKGNPTRAKGEERLTRIEERTGLMIPLQLILIGVVLVS
jgi:Na+/H+ antiporter NhaC